MNFLAHLYLSGEDPEVRIGNFIGDHVKGRMHENYSASIQQGILLHRKIDFFTDTHPLVKQSTARLHEKYGRYSGIVMDVFYDYFLANNWELYTDQPLSEFVTSVHRLMLRNYLKLPIGIKRILPFIIKSRRLETYATYEGIDRSLNIMSGYSSLPNETPWAMNVLRDQRSELNDEFLEFFQDVQQMVNKEIKEYLVL